MAHALACSGSLSSRSCERRAEARRSTLACDPWSNRLFSISAWGRKTEASLVGLRRVTVCSIRRQPVARLKTARSDEDLMFPGPEGIMNPDKFDAEVWKPIATEAKMNGTRFHDLRHFFASQLIAQGETPAYVRDRMGHASTQITLDMYGHLFPAALKESVARLESEMREPEKPAGDSIGSAMVAQKGNQTQ